MTKTNRGDACEVTRAVQPCRALFQAESNLSFLVRSPRFTEVRNKICRFQEKRAIQNNIFMSFDVYQSYDLSYF